MSESLYLTVYIIDMYLLLQPVLRRELQLVGVSALLILEKLLVPFFKEYSSMSYYFYFAHFCIMSQTVLTSEICKLIGIFLLHKI